LTEKDLNIWN